MGRDINEIAKKFKHTELRKEMKNILDNPSNFNAEKLDTSGNAIGIWSKIPLADNGTYCYYDNSDDRDLDYALLKVLLA